MGSACCSEAGNIRAEGNEPLSPARDNSSLPANIRLVCITWNVGDAMPAPLDPLMAHLKDPDGKPADIVVVAAQECNYKIPDDGSLFATKTPKEGDAQQGDDDDEDDESSGPKNAAAAAVVPVASDSIGAQHSEATSVKDHWRDAVVASAKGYTVVARKGLWHIRLVVLARDDVAAEVTDIALSKEATGIGSVAGNKGGVAIGFSFRGTKMLFVGSHLAAHLEKTEKRNSDYYEIVAGISGAAASIRKDKDGKIIKSDEPSESSEGGLPRSQKVEPLNLYQHVFWMGDLNYRIANTPAPEVIERSNRGDVAGLVQHDQLVNEMKAGKVFVGFEEVGPLAFTPTYRFLRNTKGAQREYDKWKDRVPSWCDRVLHKGLGAKADAVKTLRYDAEHGVRSSDHSPVFAVLDVPARAVLEARAARSGPQKEYAVRVTNVSCKNLIDADVGSLSDPFVVFTVLGGGAAAASGTGSPTSKHVEPVQTRTIDNTLNPVWDKAGDVFEVRLPGKHTLADVHMRHLHALVFDEDVVSDDALGGAVVPLCGLEEGAKKFFDVPVLLAGKPSGSIQLSVELVAKS